jgi:hypothetical protein
MQYKSGESLQGAWIRGKIKFPQDGGNGKICGIGPTIIPWYKFGGNSIVDLNFLFRGGDWDADPFTMGSSGSLSRKSRTWGNACAPTKYNDYGFRA